MSTLRLPLNPHFGFKQRVSASAPVSRNDEGMRPSQKPLAGEMMWSESMWWQQNRNWGLNQLMISRFKPPKIGGLQSRSSDSGREFRKQGIPRRSIKLLGHQGALFKKKKAQGSGRSFHRQPAVRGSCQWESYLCIGEASSFIRGSEVISSCWIKTG